ncbi:prepilin peptidase [Streptomyces sp. BE20]|uniref:prepilin peptidase n=1 Tax=unclassified Streptomyces TaxID=2593676 RepID=UPI002E767D5F|nr:MULTISPECIES: prepilin peptidase [unclassified Streptomyces]MED7948380.1 prepilin peptidase [Streptomyces sp. BE303]MEE1823930.1 prepilin peptidase [Streptomyces sp. BE20]
MIASVVGAVLAGLLAAPALRGLVVRYAVPEGEPWRTTCPSCARELRGLPPTGRCPGCRTGLGPGAWQVEAVTAAAAAAALTAGRPSDALLLLWAAGVGVVLGFTDARVHRLPYPLSLTLAAGLAVLLTVLELVDGSPDVLLRCLLVALAAGALFELPVWLGLMGPGDSVLALGLGALLGRYGWSAALTGLITVVLLAGLWSVGVLVAALVRRRPVRGREVPMGPFLLLGTLLTVLVQP